MNKILVFTDADRWNELSDQFEFDTVEWDDKFQNIQNDIVYKCSVNLQNMAVLQTTPSLSIKEEGIYLVYDNINYELLSYLLNQCCDDNLLILFHSNGVDRNQIDDFNINNISLKGWHDSTPDCLYYDVFDILTDDKTNKTDRIIKQVFAPTIKNVFLHGCMTPHNKSGKFCTACNILLDEPCLSKYIEEFMALYNNSDSFDNYKTQLANLRDNIEEVF